MQFPKEFKEAISELAPIEKDRLILRLLKKDLALANRLLFELVSDSTVEEEREKTKERLNLSVTRASKNFYTPDYLNVEIRSMSGEINEHVFTTKDKLGEISLNLYIIKEILSRNKQKLSSFNYQKSRKFYVGIIARIFKVLVLIKKIHEDYFLEFKDDLEAIGNLILENQNLQKTAIDNRLDIHWLIDGTIPEEIEPIVKQIRANGLLK